MPYGRAVTAVLLLAALGASSAAAQESLEARPGYFSFDEIDVLAKDHLKVEINLHGPLLKLVAGATREDEPEFSQLIDGLEAVRVRVASLAEVDFGRARESALRAARWLDDRGWQTIVRAREEGEDFYLYLRQQDSEVVGLAVLVLEEGGDVAVINIIGKIDMTQIARLGQTLKIPHLGEVQEMSEESAGRPRDQE